MGFFSLFLFWHSGNIFQLGRVVSVNTEVTMVIETLESSCEGSKRRRHVNGGDVSVPCSGDEFSNGDIINAAPVVSSVS